MTAESKRHSYYYNNNWKKELRVDKEITADIVVWSEFSLIDLLEGLEELFAVYDRWSRHIDWHATEQLALAFRQPGEVEITRPRRSQ